MRYTNVIHFHYWYFNEDTTAAVEWSFIPQHGATLPSSGSNEALLCVNKQYKAEQTAKLQNLTKNIQLISSQNV